MDGVIAVSASSNHTMAITSDNVLWVWGSNGITHNDTNEGRNSPVRIMDDVVAVSAGRQYSLAITSDGVLWLWSDNQFEQLCNGATEDRRSPIKVMGGVRVP